MEVKATDCQANYRELLKDKKRIVIKIGSSSLQHPETGDLDYTKLDVLVRELCDLRNRGKDVVLVTSGAIAVGKKAVGMKDFNDGDNPIARKQACAAVGQARLMMTYQKIFAEYNQVAAQVLMTKNTIVDNLNRYNAHNTFDELFKQFIKGIMGIIAVQIIHNGIFCHKNLSCHLIVFRKDFLIGHHQSCLSHSSTCLLPCNRIISVVEIFHAYRFLSYSYGTGGNQYHIFPSVTKVTEFSYQHIQFGVIQISCFRMLQGRGSDLYHNSLFVLQQFSIICLTIRCFHFHFLLLL